MTAINQALEVKSKLPDVGTTIFTVMSQLAIEHNAINLGQGFPEFNPDEKLLTLVNEAMRSGHNQYAPMTGIPALRQQIADKVKTLYGANVDENTEITVTSGATEALMVAIQAVVHPGDEVIVIEPNYDSYVPCIKLAGGTPVYVQLNKPNEQNPSYSMNWQQLKDAINDKTKLIILNFPHNPTGITLKQDDLDTLAEITRNRNIFLIADEVYEHIVFQGKPFLSFLGHPELRTKTFAISSFGKTYHNTGWKIGYCITPAALTTEFRKIHQFTVFSVPTPLQYALAEFMKEPSHYLELSDFYEKKHNLLLNGLKKTRFKPIASEGTFFLLADYSAISNDLEESFAIKLTKEVGVSLIPVSAFYQKPSDKDANNQILRFCFAKSDQTLEKAIELLQKI
ncbi:MAG: aminotransferase class I/II-fold pyridoxal phosphate-dependent enzyme [Alcaligenaceae bacterium]|jgi:methionine aminotransferase|nr:aminotransferase class I/II-fold pyridoxal phosphate-dependent enzyme [Alcaligenaceae bacterium]